MTDYWIPPSVNSWDGIDFAILFTLRESRRTSDSALLRDRSKVLRLHPQMPPLCGMKRLIYSYQGATLDSEALRLLHRWGLLRMSADQLLLKHTYRFIIIILNETH